MQDETYHGLSAKSLYAISQN